MSQLSRKKAMLSKDFFFDLQGVSRQLSISTLKNGAKNRER